ncbi:methyltransferase domain-containing protein [Paenibacillus athensensis]|uniref:Ubiquinone biosynthesis methyltransferase UbiE n=1 Tax=Paenibacillus athensensis TaxID=1967502 RepID=A0A4Y8QAJ3_9BACL|nr:methyltransferase domain-containing protein [Paenibacillus athensensis]MCD1258972.1 methyltransferase domain-containing protein [Paenibacillus athensensis]
MDHRIAQQRAALTGKLTDVLDARSLERSFPRLADLLRPGMTVLDAGCGTGAITRGIAEAVGPEGRVLGIDSSPQLIERARQLHGDVPGLSFAVEDVYELSAYREQFDLVTAARLFVWLAEPERALAALLGAVRIGGQIMIADYNHEKIAWTPQPPASMAIFYAAYLQWRADAGFDNAIADRLPDLLAACGVRELTVWPQHEESERSRSDFAAVLGVWADTASSRGPQMARDGFTTAEQHAAAERDYRAWLLDGAQAMRMYMLAVSGIRGGA